MFIQGLYIDGEKSIPEPRNSYPCWLLPTHTKHKGK